MNTLPITESDLHAYVDGMLAATRRAEIETYLAGRPNDRDRITAYRAQNAALRVLYNPVLREPVPARLTAKLYATHWHLQRYAAGLVIAFAGGVAGWFLHGAGEGIALLTRNEMVSQERIVASLPRAAAIAHVVYSPDLRHPVEIGADHEAQLVTWLSKRLGTPINPPKLGKLGYELIGGRLLPGQTGPVAQFMYNNSAGQRLTLYVSTEQSRNKDVGFRFSEQGPVNVFYWIDGKFGYALSGGIDKGALASIAEAVYQQLEKPS